jgi:hypothetical protein
MKTLLLGFLLGASVSMTVTANLRCDSFPDGGLYNCEGDEADAGLRVTPIDGGILITPESV